MKKKLFIICLIILVSCKKTERTKEKIVETSILPKKEHRVVDRVSEKNTDIESLENINRPKQSKIIKSKFDLRLLFGIWTYDPDGPHADFELTKKSFYVVDYNGDGDMPYVLNQDTIKVYYNDYVGIGIIKSVTKDTLKIDWDKNGVVNCVKWKQ